MDMASFRASGHLLPEIVAFILWFSDVGVFGRGRGVTKARICLNAAELFDDGIGGLKDRWSGPNLIVEYILVV